MSLVDLRATARAAGDPGLLARAIPYGATIGLDAILEAGELVGRLRYAPALVGNPALPALHGGAIGSLLESTAILQLIWGTPASDRAGDDGPAVLPKTISLTIDYLRSGRPVDTFARGLVTRQGRRVANVRVEAYQDDRAKPIAIAHGHFLLSGEET